MFQIKSNKDTLMTHAIIYDPQSVGAVIAAAYLCTSLTNFDKKHVAAYPVTHNTSDLMSQCGHLDVEVICLVGIEISITDLEDTKNEEILNKISIFLTTTFP
jgi:hypothetical protein